MKDIEKLAAEIVREMNRIDAGKSDGGNLYMLTERYLAAQREIDEMPGRGD